MRFCTLILILFSWQAYTQNSQVFNVDSVPRLGVLFDVGWKYQTGDNPEWAKPDFDDSTWYSIDPTKELYDLPEVFNAQIKWLRFDFEIKNKPDKALGLAINQAGASEIYLNGHLLQKFGHIDRDSNKVKAYDPRELLIHLPADSVGKYSLAVRYALQPGIRYTNIFASTYNRLFKATVLELLPTIEEKRKFEFYHKGSEIFICGVIFMLFILHLAFNFYLRGNKIHRLLAIYFFGLNILRLFKILGENESWVEYRYYFLNISNWHLSFVISTLAYIYFQISKVKLDKYFYTLIVFNVIYVLVASFHYGSFPLQTFLLLLDTVLCFILVFHLTRIGYKKGIPGFLILTIAIFFAVSGLIAQISAVLFLNFGMSPLGYNELKYGFSPYLFQLFFSLGAIALPSGLSLFMGIEGSETNKALMKQLRENEHLKNKAIEQEKEKQEILSSQNDTLEKQVTERTAELNQSLDTLKATQSQLIQSEKLASLGELTAGIAHEIQNPLNFVTNFSDLSVDLVKDLKAEMQNPVLDTEYINELFNDLEANQEKIKHHGKRASSIVKGMLDHSRTSTGTKEMTDINQLADEYLRLSYHGLRAKDKSFNAGFETNFQESLPKVEIVPQDFGRVLLNLINNAFYAVNQKKAITSDLDYKPVVIVSTEQKDNLIIIRVQDNGIGMPESVKSKIFQPFFTTKPSGEGTGLGLSLSYEMVTKGLGGTMEVESIDGVGTTFCLNLPFEKF